MSRLIVNILLETEKQKNDLSTILNNLKAIQNNDIEKLLSNYESRSPTVNQLISRNKKLKYRIEILKQAIAEQKNMEPKKLKLETPTAGERLGGVQEMLTEVCCIALQNAYPELSSSVSQAVQPAGNPRFGDYQYNAAHPIVKLLKDKGEKVSPVEVAKRIVRHLPSCCLIEKVEVPPAGFVNIWLAKSYCQRSITEQILNGVHPPCVGRRLRVVVDFSSPNIAKQMHVGHLRSTIIGESVSRLLEYLGHDVVRLNHVGDWGTQFGMLIAHLQDKFPNYLTVSPPIADLQAFYKESKGRFDSDGDFKVRAYNCVVKLQKFDEDSIKAWKLICDVSRKEFQQIYDKLNIKLTERGESYYQKHMEEIVKFLEEKGLLEEDNGRKVMFGLEREGVPLTVVKSDGGFTYDTSDLAALKQRIEEERADWIIYVTDLGQATHFNAILKCAQRAGIWDPESVRVDHVGFGVVLGDDKKKFKTRSGDTVRLEDLLEEGLQRAEAALKERNRHTVLSEEEFQKAKEAVAFGCIKYADLCHNRVLDYVFSFDKMLEDKGNTAVYLLYALTRIRSIARNADLTSAQVMEAAKTEGIAVDHEKEWKLAKTLLRFNDVVLRITKDLYLHSLSEYLYEVSSAVTEFYDSCYCIEKDPKTGEIKKIHMNRILLCEATALIMEKCFHILGITTLSRM